MDSSTAAAASICAFASSFCLALNSSHVSRVVSCRWRCNFYNPTQKCNWIKKIKSSSKQKSRLSASLQRCYVLRLISWGMETAVLLPVVGRGRSPLAAATAASGRLHCFVPRVMAATLPHGNIKNKLLTIIDSFASGSGFWPRRAVVCLAARLLRTSASMRPNPPHRANPQKSNGTPLFDGTLKSSRAPLQACFSKACVFCRRFKRKHL